MSDEPVRTEKPPQAEPHVNDGTRWVRVFMDKEDWDWGVWTNPRGTVVNPYYDDRPDEYSRRVNEGRIVEVLMTLVRIVQTDTEVGVNIVAHRERVNTGSVRVLLSRRVFLSRTDWECEVAKGRDYGGTVVYPSLEDISQHYAHHGNYFVKSGIVEVEMTFVRIVPPANHKDERGVKSSARRVRVFMDGDDWAWEVGADWGSVIVHPSLESLCEYRRQILDERGLDLDACGIVEVEMTLVRIVQPGKEEFGGARRERSYPDLPRVFMDKVAWDHEVGTTWGGSTVDPSLESLRKNSTHNVDECGIVEVEMTEVRIVQPRKDKSPRPLP
jgi:hypothetical protein